MSLFDFVVGGGGGMIIMDAVIPFSRSWFEIPVFEIPVFEFNIQNLKTQWDQTR